MAQFVYKKYNSNYSGDTYSLAFANSSQYFASSITGYTSYAIVGGSIVMQGSYGTQSSNGTRYMGGGSNLASYTLTDGDVSETVYTLQQNPGYYTQGSYIEQVIAEDGTLPVNGRHTDGFWYVKSIPAAPPTVTAPNGGENIDTTFDITWTPATSGLAYRVELSRDNGATWTTLTTTAANATSYTHNFASVPDTGTALIRVTGTADGVFTNSDTSDGVFTIQHQAPPTAPTNLNPRSRTVDRTNIIELSWRFNDPNPGDYQTWYEVQYRRQGLTTWTTATGTGQATRHFIAANALIADLWEWRVRVRDKNANTSPYSNVEVFTAATPSDMPSIAEPSGVVSVARPMILWSVSGTQSHYQVVIEDSLGTVVWDTGEVASSLQQVQSGIDFINGAAYTVKVRVRTSGGLFSAYDDVQVTTSYTPPASPTWSLAYVPNGHGVDVSVLNPTPTGTQPTVVLMRYYRKILGRDKSFKLVHEASGNLFRDYAVGSEDTVEYYIELLGDNDTIRTTEVKTITVPKIRGLYIQNVDESTEPIHLPYILKDSIASNLGRLHGYRQFEGREYETVELGTSFFESIALTLVLKKDMTVQRQALIDLVYSGATILYRDHKGHKMYTNLLLIDMSHLFYGQDIPLNLKRIDYREEIV